MIDSSYIRGKLPTSLQDIIKIYSCYSIIYKQSPAEEWQISWTKRWRKYIFNIIINNVFLKKVLSEPSLCND